jgi:voltage-gated potassium channel
MDERLRERLAAAHERSDAHTADSLRQLRMALFALVLLVLFAVIYYTVFEDWSVLDALYMIAITVSTVGYTEVRPLSPDARIFNMFFIFAGLSLVAWAGWNAAELVVQEQVLGMLSRRRRAKRLQAMRNHYIVCGYGRMGREIAADLRHHGQRFVVIEPDPEAVVGLDEEGVLYVQGDASDDEVLRQAGIEHARGIIAVAASDEDNVFICLSARLVNPTLDIVARCARPETAEKLRRAGATRVVSPYVIGARRIAHAILSPRVADFVDTVTHDERLELEMNEVHVREGSSLDGRTLEQARIREDSGAVIVAIYRPDTGFEVDPAPDCAIRAGEELIALGNFDHIRRLKELAGDTEG